MNKTLIAGLLAVILLSLPSTVFGATLYVDDYADTNGIPGDEGSGTSGDPYDGIQRAINEAANSDVIIVADGTYTGDGNKNLDFKGKALTLRSQNGPENCIIDCEGDKKGFHFHSGETYTSILDGFTVINGYADHGAISCFYSSPTIANCIISGNSASPSGGAGIHCYSSSPNILGCVITGNSTASSSGGAIKCVELSSPTIIGCTLSGNSSAAMGGGIACFNSSPTISSCAITGNSAVSYGGGVFCYRSSSPTITNCTIGENTADQGGGIFCAEDVGPTITNCILWGNWASDGPEIAIRLADSPASLTVHYSNVEGGEAAAYVESGCTLMWGEGNIDEDPVFIGEGNYHLTYHSPCINAGTDAGVYTDIDNDPRPLGAGYDMGSDEYGGPEIAISPESLTNSCGHGADAPAQSFEVWNSSGETLIYSITDDADWLHCSPTDGDSTGEYDTITVYYSTSGLDVGSYSTTITVSDPNATNSPQHINVTLLVISVSEISLSPASLANSCEQGTDASAMDFYLWNSGSGVLTYSISDNVDWLYCWPKSGESTGEQDVTKVIFKTSSLNAGSYSATIAITDPNTTNDPQQVYVDLTVTPADLTRINLSSPSDQSTLTSPPTFTWTPNGGEVVMFAVDASLSPTFRKYWSTWNNLQLEIYQRRWTMPAWIWDRVPSGRDVYWRVRGVDWMYEPRTVITSDVWSFTKQ